MYGAASEILHADSGTPLVGFLQDLIEDGSRHSTLASRLVLQSVWSPLPQLSPFELSGTDRRHAGNCLLMLVEAGRSCIC